MAIGAELGVLRELATTAGRRAVRLGLGDDVAATVTRDADGLAHVTGDLERFVVNFVEASPKRDSMRFAAPSDAERAALARGWQLLRGGDAAGAARLVEPAGMRIVRFSDVGDAPAVHHAMLELPVEPERLRGLGMFVQRQGVTDGLHVQVPHPWDDIATEVMGARIYRQSDGATLSVAGASRHAVPGGVSDAAHARETLFHALADQPAIAGARQLQLHGFSQAKHTSYGQAVVSTGDRPTGAARALRDTLVDHGIDARLAGDGRPYVNLAGRRNVQGIDARARGATWLHVEAGDSIRMDAARRHEAVAALVDGLRIGR